jgi:hypothetical protein
MTSTRSSELLDPNSRGYACNAEERGREGPGRGQDRLCDQPENGIPITLPRRLLLWLYAGSPKRILTEVP